VSVAFDRPLTPQERVKQQLHRMMCSVCRTQERRWKSIAQLAEELGDGAEPPPPLDEDVEARLRAALERARAAGGPTEHRDGDG
jgi:hypothetical protein